MDVQPLSYLAPLLAVWLFLLGLAVGSFLNVVIARVPYGESIVRPRSRCPNCGHQLAWYENIPLVSWLALRGRCRGCKAPISVRYPLVELLTGLLFLACLKRFDWTYELVPALVLVMLLVPLTFIDLEHWILPEVLTYPGILAGILLAIPLGLPHVRDAALGAAVGFLLFRLMEYLGWKLFRKEALGGGDKCLLALLGAFLTWKALMGIIFFSSIQGAIIGILMLVITGRAGPRNEASQAQAPEEAASLAASSAAGAQAMQPSAPESSTAPSEAAPSQAEAPRTGSEGSPAVTTEAQPAASTEEAQEPELTMTWDFTKPGIPFWKRLVLVPWCLLFQPIPDAPVDEEGEEVEWVPGTTNLPFGPWLALAALEMMLLGPWLASVLPPEAAMLLGIRP
ncbi:prepilin peptidase [Myxococcaceae bacterium GXIMD 01537]